MEARAFLDGAAPPAPAVPAPTSPKRSNYVEYNEEIALTICERIASGETLRKICDEPGFPSRSTVFRWLLSTAAFELQYKAALAWRAESRADEIIEIADDGSHDYKLVLGDGDSVGVLQLDKEALARSKIRIQARQWLMAKESPRKYGDKPVAEQPPPPANPEDARVVNETPPLLEQDPLHPQVQAWDKASKEPTTS